MKITDRDIEEITGFTISESSKKMINDFNIEIEEFSEQERDSIILKILNHLSSDLIIAGQHRLEQWEKGWYENLNLLKDGQSVKNLVPKYFGKHNIIRWKQNFYKGVKSDFDYKLLISIVDSYLHHYVSDKFENLYEFGCGPSYHLLRFSDFNPNINLFGLDWAKSSQKIIEEINLLGINKRIKGINFDFFNPNSKIDIKENSAIFTCSALEQVGEDYKSFVDFLIDKKPDLCINFEPVMELLDENNLVDSFSITYCKKRNYLNGYLNHLRNLESQGKIKIIEEKRLFCGSLFLESISSVIWKPI